MKVINCYIKKAVQWLTCSSNSNLASLDEIFIKTFVIKCAEENMRLSETKIELAKYIHHVLKLKECDCVIIFKGRDYHNVIKRVYNKALKGNYEILFS